MQLSVREVARLLNATERTVYRWIKHDGLPCVCLNDQYRFNRAELLEWATSRNMTVSPDLFHAADAAPETMPSFAGALRAGGIHYRVPIGDKETILREIVRLLPLPEGVDRDLMWRMLLAREALESTAVGEGIAIPHPRNPIVLRVTEPLIALFFLEQPVDFAALDGLPVYALFALVSPTPRVHLHLLARLFFALRQPSFKNLIAQHASELEIVAEAQRVETYTTQGQSPAAGGGPAA